MESLFDRIEEEIMDILARIEDGDKQALEELKKAKIYFKELAEMLNMVDDDETIESIRKKLNIIGKKFDSFLLSVVKVVG